MKKVFAVILVLGLTSSVALADTLKVTVDVSAGGKTSEVIEANILANVDGKITEVDITQDGNIPFKMNLKGGAFRLRSKYATKNQLVGKEEEPAPVPEVVEAKK